jgi:RimJ/RimL family protein N-acetyltransferase
MTLCEYISAYKNYTPSPLCDTPFVFDEEKLKREYQTLKNTFGVFLNEEVIGIVTLKPITDTECEFGITLLNDSFKNKGYGKTATKKTLSLLKDTKIKHVSAKTDERNLPMQRILENLGFEKQKTTKEIIPPSTEIRNITLYRKAL